MKGPRDPMTPGKNLLVPILAVAAIIAIAAVFLVLRDLSSYDQATVQFDLADGDRINFTCEVADTALKRTKGLQDHEPLAMDEGMLFIFDDPRETTFVMHNVDFPLDIIFIAGNGTVVNVEEAKVEQPGTSEGDLVRYHSDGEVKWVVEMNMGLCQRYGIGPGTHVKISLDG